MNAVRPLRFPLTNPQSNEVITEEVVLSTTSFVWPLDSDERVSIKFCLSLNEYNMIANSIDVGADIAYGHDSISVNWIWLRNMMEGTACMCGCAAAPTPTFSDRLASQTYITETSVTYGDTYNTWNTAGQTVASLAPDLDYSTGTPADIDKLMCLALEMLLIAIVEAAKANKSGTEASNRDMVRNLGNVFGALSVAGGAATAAGGAAAAFVGFIGGPYLILGLALSAVGLAIANAIWSTDLSVFNDASAIEEVKCALVDNIIGNTPTRVVFQAGLTPNTFVANSNAEKLAEIVQPYLDDLDTYLQWLSTSQGLYEVSDFGVLPECGCLPPTSCYDHTASEGLWHVTADTGEYVASEGYKGDYFGGFNETVLWFGRDATTGLGTATRYTFTLSEAVNVSTAFLSINGVGSGTLSGLTGVTELVFDASTIAGWTDKDANYPIEIRITTTGFNSWRAIETCIEES